MTPEERIITEKMVRELGIDPTDVELVTNFIEETYEFPQIEKLYRTLVEKFGDKLPIEIAEEIKRHIPYGVV